METEIFYADIEGRKRDRRGGSDPDPGGPDRPGDHFQVPAHQPGADHISEDYQ